MKKALVLMAVLFLVAIMTGVSNADTSLLRRSCDNPPDKVQEEFCKRSMEAFVVHYDWIILYRGDLQSALLKEKAMSSLDAAHAISKEANEYYKARNEEMPEWLFKAILLQYKATEFRR